MNRIKEKKPIRSYTGEMWTTNASNKKYLAEDFNHRCAYCDDLDRFNGEYRAYHVEHFAPKDKFPELKYEYSNLLYACPYCNGSKSNKWPSNNPKENVVGNKGFLDPCADEYYKHLHRNDDGSIGYDTELGEYIFKELNLGLLRHKILFKLGDLNKQIALLNKKIDIEKSEGKQTDDLEKLLHVALLNFWSLFQDDFK